jgi:hypothetical protein
MLQVGSRGFEKFEYDTVGYNTKYTGGCPSKNLGFRIQVYKVPKSLVFTILVFVNILNWSGSSISECCD